MDIARKIPFVVFIFVLSIHMKSANCFPRKRDVDSLPQIVDLMTEGQHIQSMQTRILENITAISLKIVESLEHIQIKQTRGHRVIARDCLDIAAQGPYRSGPYTITPWDERGSFKAQCDMTTEAGGWTVFQKRFNGSVDFYRNWDDYKNGFGNIDGEYWLGLDKLNRLTGTGEIWQLRVELEDFDNNTGYAQYDDFRIGDESTGFQLTFGTYSGTAGNSLAYHANRAFTTKDKDNDLSSGNCGVSHKGGWWYNRCHTTNLNGLYLGSPQVATRGMTWRHFTGNSHETLKRSEMKIRPVH